MGTAKELFLLYQSFFHLLYLVKFQPHITPLLCLLFSLKFLIHPFRGVHWRSRKMAAASISEEVFH